MASDPLEFKVAEIERQIGALRERRERLLKGSHLQRAQIARILKMRSPRRNICQLLRELHAVTEGEDREKVEQCLLIAKKMDDRLMRYAGRQYGKDWYDDDGKFIA